MNRESLRSALSQYTTPFGVERDFVPRFLDLLRHPGAYHRSHLPGHMTGSAWIIDPDSKAVLLTHHAKLDKWLQPGGHADGDENILSVAQREGQEETGLLLVPLLQENIFDLDIHLIPSRNDFPAHWHYDVRFVFRASRREILSPTSESHALAWVEYPDINARVAQNTSILRMLEKTRTLPGAN